MKELVAITMDLTLYMKFHFHQEVKKFLRACMKITDCGVALEGEKGADGKYSIKTSDGTWKTWSIIIGGNLVVCCECPQGIVYDKTFTVVSHEHEHMRPGLPPPDCGHKVPRRPRLDDIEHKIH